MSRLTRHFVPLRPWLSKVSASSMRADAMAGMTNAAVVLPQGVAFAIIASPADLQRTDLGFVIDPIKLGIIEYWQTLF